MINMTVKDLRELLEAYDDNMLVCTGEYEHDYMETTKAFNPGLETAFLCGDALDKITDNEEVAEQFTSDKVAKRVLVLNY